METVRKNFYVDDCLKSLESSAHAVNLAGQLRDLLSRGGFRLLKWLRLSDATRLCPLIIHEHSEPSQWRYVNSELNPADDASRGVTVDTMIQNNRWLSGPEFLTKEEDLWPRDPSYCQMELSTNNRDFK